MGSIHMKTTKENEIIIFKTNDGPSVDVCIKDETVWLTQSEMGELFEKAQSTINEHLKNIFKEGELLKKSNVQKMHIPKIAQQCAINTCVLLHTLA
jgi:hypothetical protein